MPASLPRPWGVQGTVSLVLACEQQCFVHGQLLPQKLRTAYTVLVGVDLCFWCPSTRCNFMRLSDLSLQLERSLISKFKLVEAIKLAETCSNYP